MNNMQMKKVLVDKLKEEGSGFEWNDIALVKQPVEYDEDIAVYQLVVKEYEHIHFIIHLTKTKMFGNEVWASEKHYIDGEEVGTDVIAMQDSKKLDHDTLLRSVLVSIGYRIANTF